MVNKRHEILGRKPVGLCKSMDGEAIDEREEDIRFHRRVEIVAKLSRLLALLKKLFEAKTQRPVSPAGREF